MIIEQRFTKRRKEAGLTQAKTAELSGAAYASIRRFETTGEISLQSLKKLLSVFHIDALSDF
ncbi:MAG: helix-turn-helix domain-containing protein [Bulleidia sp.]